MNNLNISNNPFNNKEVREDIIKSMKTSEIQPASTPQEQPATPVTPGQDNGTKQESAGVSHDDGGWRKSIPTEYQEAFAALDDASRDKILGAIKTPIWQTADYTKKTQALSAKEKQFNEQLSKYNLFNELATQWGVPVEDVAEAAKGFVQLQNTPGAKLVVGDKEVWSSPVVVEPEPDFTTMTPAEVKAWAAKEAVKAKTHAEAEAKAKIEAEMAPIKAKQEEENNRKAFLSLKASKPEISDDEWGQAIELGKQAINLYLNGETSGDSLGQFLDPFVLAVRAAKASGMIKEKTPPKTSSIDAPSSPASNAPKKAPTGWHDAFNQAKAEKGIKNFKVV